MARDNQPAFSSLHVLPLLGIADLATCNRVASSAEALHGTLRLSLHSGHHMLAGKAWRTWQTLTY
jgi:hypothetical protein